MAIDPAQLNLIATLLIVMAGAYLWSSERDYSLWWFGTYALTGLAVFVVVALLAAASIEPNVVLFAAAFLLGLSFGSGATEDPRRGLRGHAINATAAGGFVLLTAVVALTYQWWFAPLLILLLILVGLTWNYVIPEAQRLHAEFRRRRRKAPARSKEPTTRPAQPGRPRGAKPYGRPANVLPPTCCLRCRTVSVIPNPARVPDPRCTGCGRTLLPRTARASSSSSYPGP